ncbi:Bug family tripartite tricarboxylate transporter substrate binding protein [Sabulicella rubraurantiaca]|uniref:Bug family tripartite tricarboxylate transporter substrate binding protein n=1 Tax=Sabulicella rubraurantiaca TaxID=2811429 RepID=UPI001A9630DF|nr:tripartite tricarboxylate transporter substrate binding protein [Sabulicella rubraurantiaca]
MPTRRCVFPLLATAAGLATPAPGRAHPRSTAAADWPNRPVRYIEAYQPGTATDIASRLWCMTMARLTGRPFAVENRAGAGGTLGAAAVARAMPDGHTIGLGSAAALAVAPTLFPRLRYEPARDFTLISGLAMAPNLLAVRPDLPAQSVPDFLRLLSRDPGRHHYGHFGLGTTGHLAMELLKSRAGVEVEQVAYAGQQANYDLLAGRISALCGPLPGLIAAIQSGQVRALAVTTARRSRAVPQVPALAEFLPGFDLGGWAMVVGPARLSPSLIRRMHDVSRQTLARPDLRETFRQMGVEPWSAGLAELEAYRAEQEALVAPLVRASGARVD